MKWWWIELVIAFALGAATSFALSRLYLYGWLWWISNIRNDSARLSGEWSPSVCFQNGRCNIPPWLKIRIMHYQNWHCLACWKPFCDIIEIDHKVSLGEGGDNKITNFQALHPECHRIKTFAFDLQLQCKIKRSLARGQTTIFAKK